MNDIKMAIPDLRDRDYLKLKKMGLNNIGVFLSSISEKKNRIVLCRLLNTEEHKVLEWGKQLELYRLNSLDNRMIHTLQMVGITSLRDVARKTTSELYEILKSSKRVKNLSIAHIDEIISEARFSSMRIV